MRYSFRREIWIRGAFLACLTLSAGALVEAEPQGNIEIFADGKKYNSLSAYRQYQIDHLREDSTLPKKDPKSLGLDTLAIKEIAQALVQNLAGPTFVGLDEKTMKKILANIQSSALASKKTTVFIEPTPQEKIKSTK